MVDAPKTPLIQPRTDLTDGQVNAICDVIRECGFGVHKYFGPGYREKLYQRSLVHRLAKLDVRAAVQPRVKVYDEDGTEMIEEIMDLIVNDVVILE